MSSAGSVTTSMRPNLLTASLMNPWNIFIFVFRRFTVVPGFIKSTWSLRAVKMMEAVSSPTRHSAIRPGLMKERTEYRSTTLTVKVWPLVPGLSWFTLCFFFLPGGGPFLCLELRLVFDAIGAEEVSQERKLISLSLFGAIYRLEESPIKRFLRANEFILFK